MTTFTGKSSTHNHGVVRVSVRGINAFEFHSCGVCGIVWGMPEAWLDIKRKDGEGWYCPNGHQWHWSGETEEGRLRRTLKQERERSGRLAANLDQTKASLNATKGHVTRLRKRVSAGVCPVQGCKRHFKDLERHIASQHPGYQSDERTSV